jgi:N-acetylneuraminic acid mutarotase
MRRSGLFLLLSACATDPAEAPTGPGAWETLAPAPTARSEAGVALAGERIVTIGGFSFLVEIYDIATDTWMRGADFIAPADHISAIDLPDERVMVAGWQQGTSRSETFEYDPSADAWRPLASLPRKTGAAAIARVDDTVVVIGGLDGDAIADVQLYDIPSGAWRTGPPMRVPRHHLAAAVVDGRIYAIGGRNRSSFTLDVVEVLDVATETWSDGPPLQVGRSGHAAAGARGRIYVFGGEGAPYETGVFPEVEELDPSSGTWRFVAKMPTPRHGIGAVSVDDRIYLPIGADRMGLNNVTTNEVFVIPN